MQKHPAVETFQPRLVDEQDDDQQVNDDREPRGFATARTRQVVLQVKKKSGDGVFVEVTVGGFPMARIVKAGRLRRGRRVASRGVVGVIDIVGAFSLETRSGGSGLRATTGRSAETQLTLFRTFPQKPLKLRGRKTYGQRPANK